MFDQGIALKKQEVILRCVGNQKRGLRVSFGVSKKNVKKAVKRNKIKRWARQCLRQNPLLDGVDFDFLIIVEKEPAEYDVFKKKLDELIQKALVKLRSKNTSSGSVGL